MLIVGSLMLRGRKAMGTPGAACTRNNAGDTVSARGRSAVSSRSAAGS